MVFVKSIFVFILFAVVSLAPCFAGDMDAWQRKNLYDAATDSYFIPYHLWTGMPWDGGRKPDAHKVDARFMGVKSIEGPIAWTHPYLKREFSVYRRLNRGKEQLFAFYDNGIGRVYDNREQRYFDGDIKFPAGPGWKVGVPVNFKQRFWREGGDRENIRTVTIEIFDLSFGHDEILKRMKYRYSVNGKLDHEYTYEPHRGMTDLKEF